MSHVRYLHCFSHLRSSLYQSVSFARDALKIQENAPVISKFPSSWSEVCVRGIRLDPEYL